MDLDLCSGVWFDHLDPHGAGDFPPEMHVVVRLGGLVEREPEQVLEHLLTHLMQLGDAPGVIPGIETLQNLRPDQVRNLRRDGNERIWMLERPRHPRRRRQHLCWHVP